MDFPCCSGLAFNFCLVGTGLEGCWLTWCVLHIDLNHSKEDSSFSELGNTWEGQEFAARMCCWLSWWFCENCLNYKAFFHFSAWGLRALTSLEVPPSTIRGKEGCSASLLLSREKRDGKSGGKGCWHPLAHSEWWLMSFLGTQQWLPHL